MRGIELRGVNRVFPGGAGVHGIDLAVAPGEIHALVGLNGAGKTTLMRLLLGMLRPDSGEVRLDGVDLRAADAATWARVGQLVEHPLAYAELTGRANLEVAARLHGVTRRRVADVVDRAIEEFDLRRYAAVRASRLCLGNRQRVGLAAALSTSRRSSCSTSRRTASTRLASSCCASRAAPRRRGAGVLVSEPPPRRGGADRASDRHGQRRPADRRARPRQRRPRAGLLRARPRRRRAPGGAGMTVALRVEALKLARSTVGIIGSAAIVLGIGVLCAVMMAALGSGDPQLAAKLGPEASRDWHGLLGAAAQITGAGGLLGFGVVAAWLFGREFADGTVTGLFALPVGRGTIAAAKLGVYLAWAAAVSAALTALVLVLGVGLGFGAPDAATWAGLARQQALGVLSAAVAVPTAWAATVTRSLLGGVSVAIALVIVAQVGVLAGAGGWLPLAAPALWAISGGAAVSPAQLGLAVAFSAGAAGAATWAWHRLELDR